MRFHFNDRKTAQAAAFLLKQIGGKTTYGVLVKLLYLADRVKLLELGQPITGDRMISLDHGPALSRIYDIIRDGPEVFNSEWFRYISLPKDLEVELVSPELETDELSKREMEILEAIARKFGHWTFSQLRNFMHEFPEWEDPQGASKAIPPERILLGEGRPQEEIEALTSDAEEAWRFEALAASVR